MTDDNLTLLQNELKNLAGICANTLQIVEKQPTKSEMEGIAELAAMRAVDKHRDSCPAAKSFPEVVEKITDSTTRIKLLGTVTKSLAPNPNDAKWLKILKVVLPPVITAIAGALGYAAI